MRGPIVWCSSLLAAAALSLTPSTPAAAEPPTAPAPAPAPCVLDATHFVVVRGDRIIVYEVDPKKGFDLRVVNSALVDEGGRIIGQFRPEAESPATPPAASPAPAPEPPAPVPVPFSAVRRPAPAHPAHAKAAPGVTPRRSGSGTSAGTKLASSR